MPSKINGNYYLMPIPNIKLYFDIKCKIKINRRSIRRYICA
jgi:hypothetical protein